MTPTPWKILDLANDRAGYIGIRGPNNEKIADIFPFAGSDGVGIEKARENARMIVSCINDDPIDGCNEANPHAHATDGPPDEDAYRRGYQQGVDAGLRAVDAGCRKSVLDAWERAVFLWRFDQTHKVRTPPPPPQEAER